MHSNLDEPLMTEAQYARHRGESPPCIGKLAKAGILVMRGRRVDAAASDAVASGRQEKWVDLVDGWALLPV